MRKTFVVRERRGRLRRVRKVVEAVAGIDLDIERGSLVGYLGPNGAGKSTTVKMLTGILVPSAGSVRVAGLDPTRQRIALTRRIGVMFGQRVQLWWDLPLADSFELLRHVYGVPAERHRENLRRFRELLELDSFLATPVRQLSLGQRIRGELTGAMLHDPELLFLDEPTIGLDVVAKARVREFLTEVNRERDVTVLLTTHDLADVERLCDRMVIIDRGRLDLGRHGRRAEGALRPRAHAGGRPRGAAAAARRAGRARRPGRGAAPVAALPPRRGDGRVRYRRGRRARTARRPGHRGARRRGDRARHLPRAPARVRAERCSPGVAPATARTHACGRDRHTIGTRKGHGRDSPWRVRSGTSAARTWRLA